MDREEAQFKFEYHVRKIVSDISHGNMYPETGTSQILSAMQELARERSIAAIKFTRNLEYMDGSKPQHEFTEEEIYNKLLESLNK